MTQQLTPEVISIDEVHQLDKNPRRHTEAQITEMVKSVEMFGQYRPMVIDETGTILAGNGLHLALQRMGKTEVTVYRVTDLSDEQKKKLILTDNRLADMSTTDHERVEDMLREIGDFEIPGYDEELLRELLASAEDVIEFASDYGTLPQTELDRIASRTEARDEWDTQAAASAGNPPAPFEVPDPAPAAPSTAVTVTQGPVTTADGGTICPTCNQNWPQD